MPDLTVESFWQCRTAESWKGRVVGKPYTVRYGKVFDRFGPTHGWSCDCKGFIHHKNCKHVEAAKKLRCGWMQFIDGGEPIKNNGKNLCPECGKSAEARNWAL